MKLCLRSSEFGFWEVIVHLGSVCLDNIVRSVELRLLTFAVRELRSFS